MAEAHERAKLERSGCIPLYRNISRPAVSEKRLALSTHSQIRYQLKTPYRNGTTNVVPEPFDFIAKLAALVLGSRVNLSRFHGVFVGVPQHPRNKLRNAGNVG